MCLFMYPETEAIASTTLVQAERNTATIMRCGSTLRMVNTYSPGQMRACMRVLMKERPGGISPTCQYPSFINSVSTKLSLFITLLEEHKIWEH